MSGGIQIWGLFFPAVVWGDHIIVWANRISFFFSIFSESVSGRGNCEVDIHEVCSLCCVESFVLKKIVRGWVHSDKID